MCWIQIPGSLGQTLCKMGRKEDETSLGSKASIPELTAIPILAWSVRESPQPAHGEVQQGPIPGESWRIFRDIRECLAYRDMAWVLLDLLCIIAWSSLSSKLESLTRSSGPSTGVNEP